MWSKLIYTQGIPAPDKYFYYARHWWHEANVDAGLWWRDSSGDCHYKLIKSGDSADPVPPKVIEDREIPCESLSELIDECVDAGIYDLADDTHRRLLGVHCDTVVAIKAKGSPEHSYLIKAGAKNDGHRRIQLIVRQYAPEL